MKKILLILTLAFVSAQTLAQPILTSASNPVAGDKFTLVYTAPFMLGPVVPLAGPDLVWDFSTINSIGTDTLVYDHCSGSPHCSSFPGASIVSYRTDSPAVYSYYNTTDSAFSYMGTYDTAPNLYSNAEDILRYSLTYNSSYRDTFSSTFNLGGEVYHRSGDIEVTYGGYGTLTLPYGTFHDVILIRTIEYWTDTKGGGSADYYSPGFNWYLCGSRIPLVSVDMLVRNGIVIANEYYYTVQSLTGVHELEAAGNTVELFPNPSNDQCTIHTDDEFAADAYVDIVGMDGRAVARYMLHGTDFTMPISQLAPGVYTCRIYNGGLQVKKLVVKR